MKTLRRNKTIISSILFFSVLTFLLIDCRNSNNAVQIGENTFIYNEMVYRIIDNEITELGTLTSDTITKSKVQDPELKNYGINKMDFVKPGVNADLTAVYRGDVLYFNVRLNGLNDLHQKYRGGELTLNFIDVFGFQLNSVPINLSDLTRIVGPSNNTIRFEYNGKRQMSSEMYKAIHSYSISSSLIENRSYQWP